MKKKEQKQRKVTASELTNNFDEFMAAAKAGRLFVLTDEELTKEDIAENVLEYVRQINSMVRCGWCDRIEDLWRKILLQDDFAEMFKPGVKTRKFREFNKYSVMRFIGIMRSKGVYDERFNDSQICEALEHNKKDTSYRSYIGMGLEDREMLFLLREIIEEMQI